MKMNEEDVKDAVEEAVERELGTKTNRKCWAKFVADAAVEEMKGIGDSTKTTKKVKEIVKMGMVSVEVGVFLLASSLLVMTWRMESSLMTRLSLQFPFLFSLY
jgi:hypothetical protein